MRHTLANKVIFLEIRFLNVTTNIAYWKFPSINYICNITYSDGSGTRNRCFRLWKCSEEMGVRPVWQGFSSFVNKFLAYVLDDFLKRSDPKVLRNFGKKSIMSKIWQKMKKTLVELALKPIFLLIPSTRNPISGTIWSVTNHFTIGPDHLCLKSSF